MAESDVLGIGRDVLGDCLERVLMELEALEAIYPGEVEVRGAGAAAAAKAALERGAWDEAAALLAASPGLRLRYGFGDPAAGALVVRVPTAYPATAPPVATCEAGHGLLMDRTRRAALIEAVDGAAREAGEGQERLLDMLQAAEEAYRRMKEDARATCPEALAQTGAARGGGGGSSGSGGDNDSDDHNKGGDAAPLGRRGIWFHHIISGKKRGTIRALAAELGIGGVYKIGWPGVMLCEGPDGALETFVRELAALRWQGMSVRFAETIPTAGAAGAREQRRLPGRMEELPEGGGMSEIARRAAAAGVDHIFRCVLNLPAKAEPAGAAEGGARA